MVNPKEGQLLAGPQGSDTLCLVNEISRGAFGSVWKATDAATHQDYAVKFPFSEGPANKAQSAFINEMSLAPRVDHPNVVRVVHVGTDGESPYMVMEFVAGGTLRDFIAARQGRQFSHDELVGFLQQLALGMQAIHTVLVHRDLHPGNILVDKKRLQVGDFGLAKLVEATTRSQTFKGIQHMQYKAPESWSMEDNTPAMDVYSMGVIYFELATLGFPYDPIGRTQDDLRSMHKFQPPLVVSRIRPDIDPRIEGLIDTMLAKRPRDRPETWAKILDCL